MASKAEAKPRPKPTTRSQTAVAKPKRIVGQMTYAQLAALAKRKRPPQSWYDEE